MFNTYAIQVYMHIKCSTLGRIYVEISNVEFSTFILWNCFAEISPHSADYLKFVLGIYTVNAMFPFFPLQNVHCMVYTAVVACSDYTAEL